MIIGEPAPSAGDLHFRLFGFPVRVHPFFWVVALLLGLGGGPVEPVGVLVWVAVVFVSILVHELGHAFLQRYFGGRPWITLHSFGGLASCNDCDRSPRSQILICLAGPAAGFLFAALVIVGVLLAGHWIVVVLLGAQFAAAPGQGFEVSAYPRFVVFGADFEPFASPLANDVFFDLLWVNILWGLVNLLPIYPLDGGQVTREVLTLRNPRQGIVFSLWVSVVAAAIVAIYALSQKATFTCIMFGLLAYGSYQALRSYQNYWR